MKQNVSIWIGDFNSEEEFVNYTQVKYTEDGDSIPSNFEEDFNLTYYDRDLVEKRLTSKHTNSVKELLGGFSYSDQFLDQVDNMDYSENFNCAILIYDMKYDDKETIAKFKNNKMKFLSVAEYTIIVDDRW
jgi:Immunity protein 22